MRSGPSIGIGCDKCGATAVVPLSQADWNLSQYNMQQGTAVPRPQRLPVGWCHLEVTRGSGGAAFSGPSIDLCAECGDKLLESLVDKTVPREGEGR